MTLTIHTLAFGPDSGGGGTTNPSDIKDQTVLITSSMVRGSSRFVSKNIGGFDVEGHDTGSFISGYGVGELLFKVVTSTPAANPAGYRTNAIYIDRNYKQPIVTTVENTSQDFIVDIGSGDGKVHYWEFWEACNYDPNPVNTTYTVLYSVEGVCSVLDNPLSHSQRVMLYADSIGAGVVETIPLLQGVGPQARNIMAGADFCINAIPGRRSGSESASAFATAAATYTAGASIKQVIFFLGINDYLNDVPLATFATNVGTKWDALNTAVPGLPILCIGISITTLEATANGIGKVPGDYRAQLATLAGTRGWVTYVDSSTWAGAGFLADTVHLNAGGSAIVAGNAVGLLI